MNKSILLLGTLFFLCVHTLEILRPNTKKTDRFTPKLSKKCRTKNSPFFKKNSNFSILWAQGHYFDKIEIG